MQDMSVFAEEDKSHPYLSGFADELRTIAHKNNWYDADERDMVIRFVQQSIPYKTDPYNHGYDYPRYPLETLYEKRGDCEDKSCLLVSLLKTMGYDVLLLEFPGHMAMGVAANDLTGTSYRYNNKDYYYVESTSVFEPGKNPGYKKATVETVNQTAMSTIPAGANLTASLTPATKNKNVNVPPVKSTVAVIKQKPAFCTHAGGRAVVSYAGGYLRPKRPQHVSKATYVHKKTITRTTYMVNGKVIGYSYETN